MPLLDGEANAVEGGVTRGDLARTCGGLSPKDDDADDEYRATHDHQGHKHFHASIQASGSEANNESDPANVTETAPGEGSNASPFPCGRTR